MSNAELQEEEREVLLSIYDGDTRFKSISPTVYQYKYGEDNDPKSFLLEISWTKNYPEEKPQINMNTFYNKHIAAELKEKIAHSVLAEAEQYLGAAMTYTLFEYVKEKETEFTHNIRDKIIFTESNIVNAKIPVSNDQVSDPKKALMKKPHLTKAQKKRQWDRMGAGGEKPRGWDWVDIVKHLSQVNHKSLTENEPHNN